MSDVESDGSPLAHLNEMCDDHGLFEHATGDRPRVANGYCTDDAGRLLGLASEMAHCAHAPRLASVALGFLERAHLGGGIFRLRQRGDLTWTDDPASDDANARALAGLATAGARAPWPGVRERALALFDDAATFRSGHPRATAYATLGAAQILDVTPTHAAARRLIDDAAAQLPGARGDEEWPWPEERLSYANALLPDALLAIARATRRARDARDALGLLAWLVAEETSAQHFSFTPVAGRARGERSPGFDQQPIEAWAMAAACTRAFDFSGDPQWLRARERAAAWFLGDNDVGVCVYDPLTGGGYDGLERDGVNSNQGAESTMAFVATMHYAGARALCRPFAAREESARR